MLGGASKCWGGARMKLGGGGCASFSKLYWEKLGNSPSSKAKFTMILFAIDPN